MELWELIICYGGRWIVQSATALEVAELRAKEHCLEKRC